MKLIDYVMLYYVLNVIKCSFDLLIYIINININNINIF